MPCVLAGNPACRCLVRVGRGAKPGFVSHRDAAFEDEVELMPELRSIGIFPINFSDMQQFRNGNVRSDFLQAFPLQGRDEVLARFLFSAGQGEIAAFHRVLFFLNQ